MWIEGDVESRVAVRDEGVRAPEPKLGSGMKRGGTGAESGFPADLRGARSVARAGRESNLAPVGRAPSGPRGPPAGSLQVCDFPKPAPMAHT